MKKTVENIKACHEVETAYRTEVKTYPIFTNDASVKEKRKALGEETKKKMEAIEDCEFGIY